MNIRTRIESIASEQGWETGTVTVNGFDRVSSRPCFYRGPVQIDVLWSDSGQIMYARRWGAEGGELRRRDKAKAATLVGWLNEDRNSLELQR